MRSAERDFGNILLVKEVTRDNWGWQSVERLLEDVRYGVRLMLRSKIFTATVLLVLAIGIGSVTAAFSLVDAVILRSLPVQRPEQLVWFKDPSFSWPIYREVRSQSSNLFSGLFAWTMDSMAVEWNGGVQQTLVMAASGEYHSTLAVSAAAGRMLTLADERGVATISYNAWESRFGRDPAAIGSTIRIHRVPFTIVGVERKGFFGPAPGLAPEITIPVTALTDIKTSEADLDNPHRAWLHLMGRLKDGVAIEEANAALQVFWPRIMEDITDKRMPADRRARFLSRRTALQPEQTASHACGGGFRSRCSCCSVACLCCCSLRARALRIFSSHVIRSGVESLRFVLRSEHRGPGSCGNSKPGLLVSIAGAAAGRCVRVAGEQYCDLNDADGRGTCVGRRHARLAHPVLRTRHGTFHNSAVHDTSRTPAGPLGTRARR